MPFDPVEAEVKPSGMAVNHRLEKAGKRRKRDQRWDHAAAVYGETLEPLAEIVALRAKDEELVTKISYGNIQRRGEDRCEHHGEVQPARRQHGVQQRQQGRESYVPEDSVPHADAEVADKLPGGKKIDKTLQPPLWNEWSCGIGTMGGCFGWIS